MMSSTLLRETGEALYGSRWQSDLARDLHVSDRTMRRWLSGADSLPPGVAMDLWRICLERAARLEDLTDRLKIAGTPG